MSDDKSLLNQYCQKKHIALPKYSVEALNDGGFSCTLTVEDEQFHSLTTYSTKKEAERDAAGVAVKNLLKSNSAKSHEDLLKNLADITISGSGKKQTSLQPASTSAGVMNGHSPLTPATTAGRVVDSVYYPPNVPPPNVPVAPPPGFPGSPPRNSSHNHQQVKTKPPPLENSVGPPPLENSVGPPPLENSVGPPPLVNRAGPPPLENRAGPPPVENRAGPHPLVNRTGPHPLENRTGIPISITGPKIDHSKLPLTKPSGAFLVSHPTSSEPPPLVTVNQPSRGVAPSRSNQDVEDLEYYCKMSHLPSPIYTIYQERGRHKGRVRIGEMEFGRGWGYDTFDEAKDSAAVVAIAGLALLQIRINVQQGKLVVKGQGQPAPVNAPAHSSPPSPSAVTQPLRPPHNSQLSHPRNSQPSHPFTSTHFRPHTQHPPAPPHIPPAVRPQGFPPTQSSPFTHPQAPPTQPNGLHPPAFYQRPISRGGPPQPSPNTPPSQGAPQSPANTQPNMSAVTTNYKGLLNTYCQKNHYPIPTYECDSPDDITGYISTVTVNAVKYKSGVHGTKKAADADAARVAMGILGVATAEASKSSVPVPTTASPGTTTAPASNAFVSYKNLLQEKAQKEKLATPHYSTERTAEGFVSTVTVYVANGSSFQKISSIHPVKKGAEQEAAKLACVHLQLT